MRYILDDNGYVEEFGTHLMTCSNKSCTEYTGDVPEGYETIEEWAVNANIRAYQIVDGQLTYDSAKDEELQELYSQQGKNSSIYGMIAGQQISTNSSSSVAIPFTESRRVGNGLKFNGTRIEVDAGVNRVEASFLLHGQVGSSSVSSIEYGIRKNGTIVYKSAMDHTLAAYTTTYLAMPTCEIAVTEGDYLDVIVYSAKTFIVNSGYAGLSFVRINQIA